MTENLLPIEQPHLSDITSQIQQEKASILDSIGIAENYEGVISDDGEGARYTNPDEIAGKINILAASALETAEAYRIAPSQKGMLREFALVTALTELTVLGPSGLSYTSRLRETHPEVTIGVQDKQLESALAIASMHSNEVASGQGKSFVDIRIAAVTRHLLTGTQIHLMVKDTQSKLRDFNELMLLTDKLGITTETIEGGEETLKTNERVKNLLLVQNLLQHDPSISEEARAQKQQEISEELEDIRFEQTYANSLQNATKDTGKAPAIVVGTDYDFVFDHLKGGTARFWQKGVSCIADEGDLFWERENRYVLTGSNVDVLESYIRDWIAESAAHDVCEFMLKQKSITRGDKSVFEFYDEAGNDTEQQFNNLLRIRLETMRENGMLVQHESEQALIKALKKDTKDICEEFEITLAINESMARSVVKAYVPDPNQYKGDAKDTLDMEDSQDKRAYWTNVAGMYQEGWKMASRLVLGSEFGSGSERTYVIDPLTGERLQGHQFNGQTDVALDIREHKCSLRPRGVQDQNSIGFLSFTNEAYGKGRISLVSGTLTHIDTEIKEFTGMPVIVTDRWIGEHIDIPSYLLTQTRQEALIQALHPELDAFLRTGRPLQLICENDEELKFLQQYIQKYIDASPIKLSMPLYFEMVTSDTPEDVAKSIYARAGAVGSLTLTNPKGSRAVSVPTTPDAEALGGLKIHLWGPQTSNAVLRQALARTKRAGNKGDMAWTIYKTEGSIGISDLSAVQEHTDLSDKIRNLKSEEYEYSGSEIEKLHNQRTDDFAQARLSTYKIDFLRRELYSALAGRLKTALVEEDGGSQSALQWLRKQAKRLLGETSEALATDEFIYHLVAETFGDTLTDTAVQLGNSIPLGKGTYDDLIQSLSRAEMERKDAKNDLLRNADPVVHAKQIELRSARIIHTNLTKKLRESPGESPFSVATFNTLDLVALMEQSSVAPVSIPLHTIVFIPQTHPNLMMLISESTYLQRSKTLPQDTHARHILTFTHFAFDNNGKAQAIHPLTLAFDEDPHRPDASKKFKSLRDRFVTHIYEVAQQLDTYQEATQAMEKLNTHMRDYQSRSTQNPNFTISQ